jgi:hypothetical protein
MDKQHPKGHNLARVFNFRSGNLHAAHLWCCRVKLPTLKLKIWPKQLLGSLPLDLVKLIHILHAFFITSVMNLDQFVIFAPTRYSLLKSSSSPLKRSRLLTHFDQTTWSLNPRLLLSIFNNVCKYFLF